MLKPGSKLGKWTLVEFVSKSHGLHSGKSYWRCKCDCGTEREVAEHHLAAGRSRSCGCVSRKQHHQVMRSVVSTPAAQRKEATRAGV